MLDRANQLGPLRSVIVALDGQVVTERGYHGGSPDAATNIKSASKSIISALVGIAIEKGVLEGVDQKIAPLLARDLPENPDPRIHEITIGNLLSMQAGLGRMSGPNYGRWVSSRNGCGQRSPSRSTTILAATCSIRPARRTCCRRS